MTKSVAKKEDQAVALYDDPVDTGFEETGADDYAVPFVKLLQKGSPEVDSDHGSYIEGAKPGQFCDTASGEVFDQFEFVPCLYKHAIVEWAGDEPGSGFVGQHEPGFEQDFEPLVKNGRPTGKYITPEGHILQDTRYWFGLRKTAEGEWTPNIVSFSSTQIKKSKNWMSLAGRLKVPTSRGPQAILYAHIYKLSSVGESRDDYTWKGYKIEHVGQITDPELAAMATGSRDMFKGAAVSVKPPAEPEGEDEAPF